MPQNSDEYPLLTAQSGPLNGQRYPINSSLVIGRENTCDIVVPSRQVSRVHARLTQTPQWDRAGRPGKQERHPL
jgi:hypothetical protein